MRAVALVAMTACWRDPPVARCPTAAPTREVVRVDCLDSPPPKAPDDAPCPAGFTPDDCRDLYLARWAEYGRALDEWVRLYAWPACSTL